MVENKKDYENQTEKLVQIETEQLLAIYIAVSLAKIILRDVEETLVNIMKGSQKND